MESIPNPPLDSDQKWTLSSWAAFLISLAWLLALPALSLVNFNYPSDGWTNYKVEKSGGFRVTMNVTGRPSPLQEGDLVVAIDGEPYREDPLPHLPENLQVGQVMHYTVIRGGETLSIDVPLVRRDPAALARYFVQAWQQNPRDNLVAFLSLLIAAFAFFARPRNHPAQLLLLIWSYFGAAQWFGFADWHPYVSYYPAPLALLNGMLTLTWAWYFFPTWILLALSFPVLKAPYRRFPRLVPIVLYAVPAVFFVAAETLVFTSRSMAWFNILQGVFVGIVLLFGVTLAASLIHNWLTLRSPILRAQLVWITLGLGVGWGATIWAVFVWLLFFGTSQVPAAVTGITGWLGLLLPLSLAIAITRYRLFDIEVIIRRTLVYGMLTALLLVFYFGSVILLQQAFRALSGQGQDLAIILSTLAIAALVVPLRNRVQKEIDRRFYRRKYDAAQVLARFAATARDEVDLSRLTDNLAGVVEETMRPESVSVWLKGTGGGRRRMEE